METFSAHLHLAFFSSEYVKGLYFLLIVVTWSHTTTSTQERRCPVSLLGYLIADVWSSGTLSPWMEEPGRLQCMGWQRVGHNWATDPQPSGRGILWYARAEAIERCYKREMGFPGGAGGNEPTASVGDIRDVGSIPEPGRSPGGLHGNPLQYSCLENPMNRGAWWATVHRITKSLTRLKQISTHALIKLRHHSSVDIYQRQQMFSELWIRPLESWNNRLSETHFTDEEPEAHRSKVTCLRSSDS